MRVIVLFLTLLFCFMIQAQAQQQPDLTRLLRFPDIHDNNIAFVYAGDIWIVNANGGDARRLTSHKGQELFPKFSPDGKWIAFSAEYSGTRQIYVMNLAGNEVRQLTYYNDVGPMPPRGGYDYQVMGWTADSKNVLFRGNRLPWGERMGRPFLIPVDGGMEKPLAIPESGSGHLSPDGTKFVYTPIEREYRTWKRYRGGRAQDVWIYDLKNNTTERITDFIGTDNQPMWVGDKIYFTSDREHTLNLFTYDLKTKQTTKITNHNDYDVLWPSNDTNQIVYQMGGYLYKLDTRTGKSELVPIKVSGDLEQTMPYYKNVKGNIENYSLSPTGARALFNARGDIFTVPAKEGEPRNISMSPTVRELSPTWSPDGKWIAYLSDRTGEYEIYLRKPDGTGEEKRITTDGDIWRFPLVWSPNSKFLLFGDKKQRLRYANIDTGKVVDVDHSAYNDINDYSWSPDSKWIAYTKNNDNQFGSIWVYSLANNKPYQLTSGFTDDGNPVFDPKGRYIYFVSNRDFTNLTFSSYEFNYLLTNPTRVYVGILSKDGPALFLPTSDEEKKGSESEDSKDKDKDKEGKADDAAVNVKIDFDGFEDRVRAIPGGNANYRGLNGVPNGVLYMTGGGGGSQLKLFNIESKKEEVILDGVNGYDISADYKKVIFNKGGEYGIAPLQPGQKPTEGLVNLTRMEMRIEPKAEWQQMYKDGWRILRDWFYDPSMHGLDWKKMGERYQALVPYIASRADLDFVLGELGAELNAGHVYVNSSGEERIERVDNGLLGAEISAHSSGYYQIDKIFHGENWQENFRSPLTEPGVKVNKGDFILAVDGVSTKTVKNFYQLMENKANRVITILVNSRPDTNGAHEERVRPVKSEGNLRYIDWLESRRAYVEKASNGRIGYIYLPNTALEGNRELFKYFYPQVHKEALIIDDRYNGGGFIPDRMIELLDRPVLNYWAQRGLELTSVPGYSHTGPKVTLINGYSSSGGDAFPYYFRKRGLGKLIGTRTWGGLIGISGNPPFIDGGSYSAPRFRFIDTDGKWAVENEGVSPDIEVIDRADLVVKGQDPSLEKGVEYLLEELKKNPVKKITRPPAVDESK